MSGEEVDPAVKAFGRVAMWLGAVVLAIFLTIIGLYRGPPVPSPYGCYEGAGSPVVRLLPGRMVIGGASPLSRRISIETNKTGYWVSPGFAFDANAEGVMRPVDSDFMTIIYARPRETPYLSVAVNGVDNIWLRQGACPPSP